MRLPRSAVLVLTFVAASCRSNDPSRTGTAQSTPESGPVEVVVAVTGAPSARVELAPVRVDGSLGDPLVATATETVPARFQARAGAWVATVDGGLTVQPWTSEPLQALASRPALALTAELAPASEIRGRVALRGTPAAQLAVGAEREDPNVIWTSVECTEPVKADGSFVLPRLAQGAYLVALCSGNYPLDVEKDVAAGTANFAGLSVPEATGTLEVALTMSSAAIAQLSARGAPSAHLVLEAIADEPAYGEATVPVRAGTQTLVTFRLPPGSYDAAVRVLPKPKTEDAHESTGLFANTKATVARGAGSRVVLAPEAQGTGAFRFTVTSGGAPLAKATTQLFLPRPGPFARAETVTNDAGVAELALVSSREWEARAYFEDRYGTPLVVHPEAGVTKDIALQVPSGPHPRSFVPAVCSRWDERYLTITQSGDGLLPGDRIIRADGAPIEGMSWERHMLLGDRGTPVVVDVLRPATGETFQRTLRRTVKRSSDCQSTYNHLDYVPN